MNSRLIVAASAAAFACLCWATAAEAEIFTLTEALSTAYETNPRLEEARASLRATDEDVASALSGWHPWIGVSGTYGYTNDDVGNPLYNQPNGHPRDVTVTITQPIFNGSTIPRTRQAKAAVAAGRETLSSVEQSVLFAAAKAYFDVTANEAQLGYRRDNQKLLSDQFEQTQERVKIQDLTVTDLELVRARLNSANASVTVAESDLATSRATFVQVIGRPAEMLEASPRIPPLPATEDEALDSALKTNPDLAAAREQAQVADAEVDAAIGALYPRFSVQGQYRKSADEVAQGIKDQSTAVIAQLNIPLFQQGSEYAAVRKAKELRNRATLAITDADRQVRQNVDGAWQAQMATHDAIVFLQQQVTAARAAYDGFAEQVRAGEATTFDLVNAAQDLVNARVALADAQRRYYTSVYQLLVATGALTARSLNLPVKYYDPQSHYESDAARWIGLGD
jgi:outer membrane protein